MKFGSVCSGIEAASCAWESLGWKAQWFSEIEQFPCAVLAHHYPTVPNFGDMTKFKDWSNDANIDVLVGGTPCQSFSVAGLRKGLDDPRGNLMLTYLAIANKYRPKWLVWENVPGVLSSGGGEDFASLLRGMGELGYGFAYRVLDAQYLGVAQRRRRVFVVGCVGDWRSAAAVLFERHSLSGNPAPSREKRKNITAAITDCIDVERTGTITASFATRNGAPEVDAYLCVPVAIAENIIGRLPQNGSNGDGLSVGGPMYTLNATGVHGVAQPIPLDLRNAGRDPEKHDEINRQGVGVGESGDPAHTLTSACVHGVAVSAFGGEVSDTVTAKFAKGAELLQQGAKNGGNCVLQSVALNISDGTPRLSDVTATLDCWSAGGRGSSQQQAVMQSMAVRRLTPVECERLQGFPDNYTNIPWRKKEESPDGPRYKALGNSMAVPVMKWIGQRIQQVELLK